jgi:diaminopimelate decarboxylase
VPGRSTARGRDAELVARFGTPCYVYDLDLIDAARRDLFAALPADFDLFYAVKANPHPDVVAALRAGPGRRCRAEVSSERELAVALAAGYPAQECLYTGPGKTTAELTTAVRRGVRLFSAESPGDLRRIGAVAAAAATVADCLLRINALRTDEPGPAGGTGIRMTGAPSQFGIDGETLPGLLPELSAVPGTRLVGAHFFAASNAPDEAGLLASLRHGIVAAARLHRDTGLPIRLLDIGGGFASPYAAPGDRPRYPALRGALTDALDAAFPRWRAGEPRVACESGRYLTAESGRLLCGVVNVKDSRGRRFVVLDAGINALGGMSGLGRLLPMSVRPAEAAVPDPPPGSPAVGSTLVGSLCTPADVLGREVVLPAPREADVITIPFVGAYGLTASLVMFLGRPVPTEVVVRGDEVVSVSRLDWHRHYEDVPDLAGYEVPPDLAGYEVPPGALRGHRRLVRVDGSATGGSDRRRRSGRA